MWERKEKKGVKDTEYIEERKKVLYGERAGGIWGRWCAVGRKVTKGSVGDRGENYRGCMKYGHCLTRAPTEARRLATILLSKVLWLCIHTLALEATFFRRFDGIRERVALDS